MPAVLPSDTFRLRERHAPMVDESRVSPHWPFKFRDGRTQKLTWLEAIKHRQSRARANASTYTLSDADVATLAAWGIDHTKPGYWRHARGILLSEFGITSKNLRSFTAVDALSVLARKRAAFAVNVGEATTDAEVTGVDSVDALSPTATVQMRQFPACPAGIIKSKHQALCLAAWRIGGRGKWFRRGDLLKAESGGVTIDIHVEQVRDWLKAMIAVDFLEHNELERAKREYRVRKS